jgi:probable phosphoglycerate mutase
MTTVRVKAEPEGWIGTPVPSITGEVVLVRHGQGECNAAGVIGGRRGCRGLSEEGRRQSHRLGGRLAKMHAERAFDVLLCSPRSRVLQCATIIGEQLVRPVTVMEELAGQEFGVADGQSWEQVTTRFGGPPGHDPGRPIALGGESWNVYTDRVLAALAVLLSRHPGRRILVAAHGKTIGLAGGLLSGAPDPLAAVNGFIVDHGALSHWRQRADGWDLLSHNDSQHLIE